MGQDPETDRAGGEPTPGPPDAPYRGPERRRKPRDRPQQVTFADPARAKRILFGLALLVLVVCYPSYGLPAFGKILHGLRMRSYDLLSITDNEAQRWLHPARPPPARVAVVGIDDASLDRYGRWPWQRSVLAELVQGLVDLGVRTVALDILLAEPQWSPLKDIDQVLAKVPAPGRAAPALMALEQLPRLRKALEDLPPALAQDPAIEELRRRLLPPWEDEVLEGTLAAAGNVVLGIAYERIGEKEGKRTWIGDTGKEAYPPRNAVELLEAAGAGYSGAELQELWEAGLFASVLFDQARPFPLVRVGTHDGVEVEARLREWNQQAVGGAPADGARLGAGVTSQSMTYGARFSLRTGTGEFKAGGLTLPLAHLTRAAAGCGFMNDQVSADAVVRVLPLATQLDDFGIPSLVLAAVAHYYGGRVELEVAAEGTPVGFRIVRGDGAGGGRVVRRFPCGNDMELWVRFYGTQPVAGEGGAREVPVVPVVAAARVLDHVRGVGGEDGAARAAALRADLQGSMVFVGVTAFGTTDFRSTPLGDHRPGVEAHAALASNILEERVLLLRQQEHILLVLSTGVFLGVLAFLLPRLAPFTAFLFTLALAVISFLWCWVCYRTGRALFPWDLVYPLILFFGLGVTYLNRVENKEKAWLDGMFKRYVSPEYVEQIKANKGRLDLTGKETEITPFFSDMARFSTISEAFTAEGLFRFLGEYLGEMADILDQHRGTLDKFEGDAVVAFFGAPIHYPDHAARACLASLAMQRRIAELEAEWKASDRYPELHRLAKRTGHWFPIRVRIGLNTGPCATGHLGTAERGNYTMMGDTVNLAARLESAGKQYGIQLTISQATRDAAGDVVVTRPVDVIQVVGRTRGTPIFEVVGEAGQVPAARLLFLEVYRSAWAFYLDREFEKARGQYLRALEMDPEDQVSRLFMERCEQFLVTPPAADWDGVFVLTEK